MDGKLAVLIVFGTGGSVIAWVFWVVATNIRRSKTARYVAELHNKLLDKCTTSQDVIAYLESGAGRRFLESTATETANPVARILNAVQAGAITTLLGIAILLVRNAAQDADVRQVLITVGSVALAIGLGFLASAAVSYYLCKSWGLLKTAEAAR
jgi:hypothetical protein